VGASSFLQETNRFFLYFSQLIGMPVLDREGKTAGKLHDIIVGLTKVYPISTVLILRRPGAGRRFARVDWSAVAEIDLDEGEIRLSLPGGQLRFFRDAVRQDELSMRRDILDQQVVDTHDHKVIRVNDIHLLFFERSFMIAHVDIGLKGLLRSLGLERPVGALIRLFNPGSKYLKQEQLISWKHIQPLTINPASATIKVDVPQKKFSQIPAADLGEILLDLSPGEQSSLFKSLDLDTQARVFIHLDGKTQRDIVEELPEKQAAELLNRLPSDEATDFLETLPKVRVERLLGLVESRYAKKLSQLLGYSSDSAGGLMTADYLAFPENTPVGSALQRIKERSFRTEPIQMVYIVDQGGRLVGSTSLRRLILADASEPIQNAAFARTHSMHVDSSVKEIAYLMEKYKAFAIPVVDSNQVLQGIITVDDVLSQIIPLAWRRLRRS
jgi:CBS domain-containing protein/sporulation protein YlmC with PRC-barrel domain